MLFDILCFRAKMTRKQYWVAMVSLYEVFFAVKVLGRVDI